VYLSTIWILIYKVPAQRSEDLKEACHPYSECWLIVHLN
jgi:hypothetical protein